MIKLTDTQQIILGGASQHPGSDVRNHMQHLKSPAIRDKVIESMLKQGLIEEDAARDDLVYIVSEAGYQAIGMEKPKSAQETEAPQAEESDARERPVAEEKQDSAPVSESLAAEKPKREGASKKQIMIDMLSREEGVTHKQLMEATGWQKHSVHGGMANLNKELIAKRQQTIIGTKADGAERVYKIAAYVPVKDTDTAE